MGRKTGQNDYLQPGLVIRDVSGVYEVVRVRKTKNGYRYTFLDEDGRYLTLDYQDLLDKFGTSRKEQGVTWVIS